MPGLGVFAIAEAAYEHICAPEGLGLGGGVSQAVLVSGESGAGKTEAVKIMMNYLAAVSKAGDTNLIAQQVLASNPLLEAFGNAKTARNDNSSRFGKLIKLHFSPTGGLSHATVAHYLLEKSRVVSQQESEQAYHVAYYLLHGAPAALRASLHLTGAAAYAPASPASPGTSESQQEPISRA
jgi:myosin-5